jgi:hypothetical protein
MTRADSTSNAFRETDGELARELCLAAAATAAARWAGANGDPERRRGAIRELRRQHERIVRVAGRAADQPLGRFLDCLGRPVAEWLPGELCQPDDERLVLLDGSELSLAAQMIAVEYRVEARDDFGAEVGERHLARLLFNAPGDDGYRAAREAVIRMPAGELDDVANVLTSLGVGRDEPLYTPVPASAVCAGVWWPCPLCGWPMYVHRDRVRCVFQPHAVAGADYRLKLTDDSASVVPRGPGVAVGPPDARQSKGWVVATVGAWRFIVIPGLVELRLAERVAASVPGAVVVLWPGRDRFDLEVVLNDGRSIMADVKDWTSPSLLLAYLQRRAEGDWVRPDAIVVPDYRREHVRFLRQEGHQLGPRFFTESGFVKWLRARG